MSKYVIFLAIAASATVADITPSLGILSDARESSQNYGAAYDAVLNQVVPSELAECFTELSKPVINPWEHAGVNLAGADTQPPGTDAGVDQDGYKLAYPNLEFDRPMFGVTTAAQNDGLLRQYWYTTNDVLIVRLRRDVFVESVRLLSVNNDVSQELISLIPQAQTEFQIDAWMRAAVYVENAAVDQHIHSLLANNSYSHRLRGRIIQLVSDKMSHFRDDPGFDRWTLWDGMIDVLYQGRANEFEQLFSARVPLVKKDPKLMVLYMNWIEHCHSIGKISLANSHISRAERIHGSALGSGSFRARNLSELSSADPIYVEVLNWVQANRQYYELEAEPIPD